MHSLPRVLIVEDDDSIRELLLAALQREPLLVDSAEDGEDALRLAALNDYAVIVLDLMMPRVDGFVFLQRFESRKERPVIFVVTAFDDLVVERIPAHSAHAIIRKPFDVLRLVMTIREVATAIQATKKVTPEIPPPPEERRVLDSIC
jgi:two-component system response regulator ResD